MSWLRMTLVMLASTLWIVLLAVLVWVMFRWLNTCMAGPVQQTKTLPESGPTAIAILSQRYARGEIDATISEQMRERLESTNNRPPRGWTEGQNPVRERLFDGITGCSNTG